MIKIGLTLLLAVFLIPNLLFCQNKTKKDIGIQLYSVRDDMKRDPVGTIEKLGEMGYAFVEMANYNDGLFYGMVPKAFRKLVEDNGMSVLSSHKRYDLPDAAHWDETMKQWEKCIDDHVLVGAKYLVQPSMDEKGYGSLEDLKRYCNYFNAIGELCNAKGIRFGYHNHNAEFKPVDGMLRYDFMLANTDPEKVMFQMDLYWVQQAGHNPLDYFEKYPGRFELWHLKDKTELGGEDSVVDFKSIFEHAEKAGLQHPVVEVQWYSCPPIESVEKSLQFLQQCDFVN